MLVRIKSSFFQSCGKKSPCDISLNLTIRWIHCLGMVRYECCVHWSQWIVPSMRSDSGWRWRSSASSGRGPADSFSRKRIPMALASFTMVWRTTLPLISTPAGAPIWTVNQDEWIHWFEFLPWAKCHLETGWSQPWFGSCRESTRNLRGALGISSLFFLTCFNWDTRLLKSFNVAIKRVKKFKKTKLIPSLAVA